jgi:hypothetical protein
MTIKDVLREMREYAATLDKPMPKWADALEEAMREPVGEVVKLGSTTTVMLAVKPPDGTKLYALPPIDTREPTCRESADTSTCPHLVTSNGNTSYCDLAESAMRERDAEIERLKADRDHERWLREQAEYVTEATRDQREELREETERLLDLLSEAADDLTDFINAEYPPAKRVYPSDRRRYDSDMEIVRKILAALAKEDKPNG